jgi:hypothetical protein
MMSKMKNANLHSAKKEKNDEFYTQLSDIENELKHYSMHFRGKTVLCNCDDPRVSAFFRYFYLKFCVFGLKKIIAVCYKNLNPDLFSQNKDEKAVYCIYDGKGRKDDVVNIPFDEFIKKNEWGILKGNGDFRSKECIELLKQTDIVCTNPPFSLFREYVAQLIAYDKKFVVIGNKNAITYKEIFHLIKENKLWCGYTPMGIDMLFDVPQEVAEQFVIDKKEGSGYKIVNGVVKGRSQSIWFTNMDHVKRHEELILYKKYTPKEYPKYDNYDAIEVSKVAEIPEDYDGAMGVPITFLDKYNPNQFEVLGLDRYIEGNTMPNKRMHINGKEIYARILIRKKSEPQL